MSYYSQTDKNKIYYSPKSSATIKLDDATFNPQSIKYLTIPLYTFHRKNRYHEP